MALPRITSTLSWTADFMPGVPDGLFHASDLFGSDWEQRANPGNAVQATYDLPVAGETDNGLRITVAATEAKGSLGNGLLVEVAVDDSLAASEAEYADGVLTITLDEDAATFAGVKTAVDALTEFSSAYYGNAGGTDEVEHQGGEFSGGVDDRGAWAYIRTNGDAELLVAASDPDDADHGIFIHTRSPLRLSIPPATAYTPSASAAATGAARSSTGSSSAWSKSTALAG